MFNIGDKVWVSEYRREGKQETCPDCLGQRELTVIMGDGTHVRIDCIECRRGFISYGTIESSIYRLYVSEKTINGIDVDRWESKKIEYRCDGITFDSDKVFKTESEAIQRAEKLALDERENEIKRMKQKEKDHRSWAWNATYHRKCIREAEKTIAYHQEKLGYALPKVKEEKLKQEETK